MLKKVASIDLGTNTCLLLVGLVDQDGFVQEVVSDHATVVRLGQGVGKEKRLQPDAIARTVKCLEGYSQILKQAGIPTQEVKAVATSQARDARNGAEFFQEVEEKFGFTFRTLSGEEEARASFYGSLPTKTFDFTRLVVIDIGGGSTEYVSVKGGVSLDIGSVRFTERYFPQPERAVTDSEFWACRSAIDESLKTLNSWKETMPIDSQWVGVAGTITTLAQWFLGDQKYNADSLNSCELTRGDLHRLVEELKWRTPKEREALPGVSSGRADVLLAGAMILWRSLEYFQIKKIRVSSRGLRFGVWKI